MHNKVVQIITPIVEQILIYFAQIKEIVGY